VIEKVRERIFNAEVEEDKEEECGGRNFLRHAQEIILSASSSFLLRALRVKYLFPSLTTARTTPLPASARRKTILHPVPGDRPGVRGPNRSGAKGTPLLQPPHGVGDGGTQWSRPTCVRRGGGPKKPPPSGAIGTTAAVRAGKARHAAPARATGPRGCRTLGFNDRHLSPAGLRGGWLEVMVMNAEKIDPRRPRRTRNRTNFKKNHFDRAVTGSDKMPVLKKSVLIRG